MCVELGRRVSGLCGEGGVVEGGVVPLRLEPDPERARKAEKKDRGEGGEVDIDGCSRGRTGPRTGEDDDDIGAEVGGCATEHEVEAASPVAAVSAAVLADPFFFCSSSSLFCLSSSSVCKLWRMASCNIISSASSRVILINPSTLLPTLLCSPIPCNALPDPFVTTCLLPATRVVRLCPATARACCNAVAVASRLASTLRRCAKA